MLDALPIDGSLRVLNVYTPNSPPASEQEEALTARAVRNLPWSAELWCRRLRSLERSSAPGNNTRTGATLGGAEEPVSESSAAAEREKEMRKVWKEALGSALPSPDEYVKVIFDLTETLAF